MTAPLRLTVFDVDGTLVDSQNHIVAAMELAFASAGLAPPAPAETLEIVGLSLPVAVRRMLPDASDSIAERVTEGYRAAYAQGRIRGESPLYPGALEVLEALAGQPERLMGVATGKSRRGLDRLLDGHGLRRFFVTAQVADDHPSKPHPSMLEAALRETGAEARHAVMIGDTSYDIEMGRAAGMRTIGVSWGYHAPERLAAVGADAVVHGFPELGELLALWEREAP